MGRRVSKLVDKTMGSIKSEEEEEKIPKESNWSFRAPWDNTNQTNRYIMGVPEGEEIIF